MINIRIVIDLAITSETGVLIKTMNKEIFLSTTIGKENINTNCARLVDLIKQKCDFLANQEEYNTQIVVETIDFVPTFGI
jgi:hypothetical protein